MAPDDQPDLAHPTVPFGSRSAAVTGQVAARPLFVAVGLTAFASVWLALLDQVRPATALVMSAASAVAGLLFLVRRIGPGTAARALPGGRRNHEASKPQVGGWVLGPITMVGLIVGFERGWILAAGTALVWGVGVVDDLRHVHARSKLAVQFLAALVVAVGGVGLPVVGAPGLGMSRVELGGWADLVLVGWILFVTNAFNLIDGLDGLLGMVTLIALAGLAAAGVTMLPLAVMAGAVLGVLAFNLPRARVYFGDSGSLVAGFVSAVLCTELPAERNLPLAIGLLALPLLDASLAIARRWVRGIPWSAADRGHVHHRIGDLMGGRAWIALAVLTALALIPFGLSLWRPGLSSLALSLVAGVIVVLAGMRLGRTRSDRLVPARAHWQRLYLVERYVSGWLRIARRPIEVRQALERLVADLPVGGLRVGPWQIGGPPPHDSGRIGTVPLQGREPALWWGGTTSHRQADFVQARATVVCEVVRLAMARLDVLESVPPATEPPSSEDGSVVPSSHERTNVNRSTS